VISLAGHLDLNSLHDLSRTCRQFRANLLQCRKQLIAHSLRCSKEDDEQSSTLADRLREARLAWRTHGGSSYSGRITSGKVGKCARDMVAECRSCGTVVCRVSDEFTIISSLWLIYIELHRETSAGYRYSTQRPSSSTVSHMYQSPTVYPHVSKHSAS
jgi:hypothetical protein